MKRVKDLVTQKQNELIGLKETSGRAIDMVTSTINQLADVNDEIDSKIAEIEKIEAGLAEAKSGFDVTRLHNVRIIEKFRNLIEV